MTHLLFVDTLSGGREVLNTEKNFQQRRIRISLTEHYEHTTQHSFGKGNTAHQAFTSSQHHNLRMGILQQQVTLPYPF